MIPVYLQQFKAAGVYRVVFDQSTVLNVDSQILRLVVGYSEKGPFNIPVYVTNATDFRTYFGDISKKLEKRGVFFHRLALQALQAGPILCLNLKKFENETVDGSTINTGFNPSHQIIEDVQLKVEDIYDTSRFWELDAEKLNNLPTADGSVMDQYINICTTNTKETSASYFIRKASGLKVSKYNITVSDWYSTREDQMPDFLENYQHSLISDFFAEVYVFGTKFEANQVLASSTLKKYFEVVKDENGKAILEDGQPKLKLTNHITDAYGDWVDTLDELYADPTSHALGHYVGCLIPEFMDKNGNYVSLNIMFNQEQDEHNMMMSFNTDMLYEDETAHIDLSGRLSISTAEYNADSKKLLTLGKLFNSTIEDEPMATSSLLGNDDAPVIVNKVSFINNVVKEYIKGKYAPIIPFSANDKKISGTMYVSDIINLEISEAGVDRAIVLKQVGRKEDDTYIRNGEEVLVPSEIEIQCTTQEDLVKMAKKLGAIYEVNYTTSDDPENPVIKIKIDGVDRYFKKFKPGFGTVWTDGTSPFIAEDGTFLQEGPQRIITNVARIDAVSAEDKTLYEDFDKNMKVSIMDVVVSVINEEPDSVYGSSISFIPVNTNSDDGGWDVGDENNPNYFNGAVAFTCENVSENTLYSFLQVGDCFLAADGSTSEEGKTDDFYDNVYVQEINFVPDDDGNVKTYYITFSGQPLVWPKDGDEDGAQYLVRVDNSINQEIGYMYPRYLQGYSYANSKPAGVGMKARLDWQKFILSTLTDYKGLRIGLMNKSDIDYRYIVDTFESFVDSSLKSVLSYLAKQKESAFAILNFPAIKTFTKCPYTSFTNNDDVFDVKYIADGYNKKKATAVKFSLPDETEGASFCAFYTPLKFSNGYVDSIIPSAALVSNLFMQKYISRQPYYIIAGPNYGKISANGLVGPDYNFSKEELYILEPFGVNCMVYRPGFGTFINSNQTAKQTPVSALSKVNIRELVIYLQDEIEKVLQAYQWEFNNQTTRNAILDKANSICSRIAANGGIEAYLNVMDESNNTNEIIENEMAILSTAIEPGFGCGKMIQELTIYRRGTLSARITE